MKIKSGKYRHFKGGLANVIGVAKHTEEEQTFVVYYHIDEETGKDRLFARPKEMFLEGVTRDGKTFKRFTLIED